MGAEQKNPIGGQTGCDDRRQYGVRSRQFPHDSIVWRLSELTVLCTCKSYGCPNAGEEMKSNRGELIDFMDTESKCHLGNQPRTLAPTSAVGEVRARSW